MAPKHVYTVENGGIFVAVDLRAGHLKSFRIVRDGRVVEPLSTAPWVDDAEIASDETIPLMLRSLSGDFFCAPFGDSGLDDAPIHGWSANSSWKVVDKTEPTPGRTTVRFELERKVLGAKLIKEFSLVSGHPFLYQRHIFVGGKGALPVANHAMTRFDAAGGSISFSPKLFGELPGSAVEPDPVRGRSTLQYPARFVDPTKVPTADGGFADITRYPIASGTEEFLTLVEDPRNAIGWAAAVRYGTGDAFLSLKSPADLPVTMMWISNGGRYYSPWNRRHTGVLGLEEGRTSSGFGRADLSSGNPWRQQGIATALELDPGGEVEVRNVIGGLPLPKEWLRIDKVEACDSVLVITGQSGEQIRAPFDCAFLTN